MVILETNNFIVKFDDSKEIRDAVFERVMQYFVEHESFSGECIMQCDNPLINAPEVLSEIADSIIRFDVECL